MRIRALLWWIVVALLAACSSDPAELPTLVASPTLVAESGVQLLARRTLPPTFTPTDPATEFPTFTRQPSITPTRTISVTASATITDTPSLTPTISPTPIIPTATVDTSRRPSIGLLELALTMAPATPIPPGANIINPVSTAVPAGPTPCAYPPTGIFATVLQREPGLSQALGCPQTSTPTTRAAALQPFERGYMIWIGEIYAIYTSTDTYQRFIDTFIEGNDPETTGEMPPGGLVAPRRGFLKVWDNNPGVRNALGWGLQGERGAQAQVWQFANGRMVAFESEDDLFVLIGRSSGTVAIRGANG